MYCFGTSPDEMLEKQGTEVDKVLNFEVGDSILKRELPINGSPPCKWMQISHKTCTTKISGIHDDVRGGKTKLIFTNVF